MNTTHYTQFATEITSAICQISADTVESLVHDLDTIRNNGGRVAVLGIGGSAGNASHFVNDLRKLCRIDAYCPTDNVSELTARTNDDGFDTIFSSWLSVSQWSSKDAIFILSVGGGSVNPPTSVALIRAILYAKEHGCRILGIVGKDDGQTALQGDTVVVVPGVNPSRITPYSEAIQSVVWHALVSHPALQLHSTRW